MSQLLQLQNGSDIRGIASTNENQDANLTVKEMAPIAKGIFNWLTNDKNEAEDSIKIAIGRDSRLSGPELSKALRDEFVACGVTVLDVDLATTPALFMSTQFDSFDCTAGIMLTASHLPYYFNGIKIFTKSGGAEKEDIRYILSHTEKPMGELKRGQVIKRDLMTPYAQDLVGKIRKGMSTDNEEPLKGLKIIVDAGNGAGGFFAKEVLEKLGANTEGSQFLEPDGRFPNHIPNPDNKEAMESIQQAVITQRADLGVIFDTDVDRSALVTQSGEILNRNNLIAVLSRIVLNEHPGTSIVTNSPTSSHLKAFIEQYGGKQVRYISGYRNVINKGMALNEDGTDCQLAIETSGHAAFKENYFLDDGAYVIAKILMLLPSLIEQGSTLEQMISELKQPVETQEIRFKLEVENDRALGGKVMEFIRQHPKEGWTIDNENHEGVRFNTTHPYGSGWFLLRMSLHEPLLVLQVENDQKGHVRHVLAEFPMLLSTFEQVNQEKLKDFLKNH